MLFVFIVSLVCLPACLPARIHVMPKVLSNMVVLNAFFSNRLRLKFVPFYVCFSCSLFLLSACLLACQPACLPACKNSCDTKGLIKLGCFKYFLQQQVEFKVNSFLYMLFVFIVSLVCLSACLPACLPARRI